MLFILFYLRIFSPTYLWITYNNTLSKTKRAIQLGQFSSNLKTNKKPRQKPNSQLINLKTNEKNVFCLLCYTWHILSPLASDFLHISLFVTGSWNYSNIFSASKVLLLFPLSFVFLVQMGILAFNLFSLLTAFDNSNHSFLKGKFSFLGFYKTIFPHFNPTIFCPSTQSPLPISQM